MRYLIRTDQPFRGIIQSYVLDNGLVAYSENLTPEQYAAKHNEQVRVVDETEFDAMMTAYVESQVSEPVEETYAQFDEALNCLPPYKWRVVRGVELFHLSERLSHNLVTWHAKLGNRYFTFTDRDNADMEKLAEKVAMARDTTNPRAHSIAAQ